MRKVTISASMAKTARLVLTGEKVCTGRVLAAALAKSGLPDGEAAAWYTTCKPDTKG